MGFGRILVWNDDEIAPKMGFGAHPHDNMEIITYVRQGGNYPQGFHRQPWCNRGWRCAGDACW
ncbi:pirin family protein [Acidocella aminolytica]|uniref:pirin family protein n=1 Tax=Acidocella aminolytica TaxID=33998 RepID=UPI00278C4A94|nr:pirin family protein [Acidocella aminolytica]